MFPSIRSRVLQAAVLVVGWLCLIPWPLPGQLAPNAASSLAAAVVADPIDEGFQQAVRPYLESYCLGCHGAEKPQGGLNLARFTTADEVAGDLGHWELVQDQLEAGAMPPERAKRHPADPENAEVLQWIAALRKREAHRNAGDPGPVPARRLSNAEYDHTIRDLTGVDIRPTREFPVDPANEAGFDNSGESLSISPALVKKYLEAARQVADHLVLSPDGLAFAPHPVIADTDRDRYCVSRIIDFYRRQPTDLADYFRAAWRYQHRAALGRPDATLDEVAREAGVSPRYLATLYGLLDGYGPRIGPIAAVRVDYRLLPEPVDGRDEGVRAGCERLRDAINGLRAQLVPVVKNLPARGINEGSQSLVLWKNRQMAANRMRYVSGASSIQLDRLPFSEAARSALAVPANSDDLKDFTAGFEPFCRTFPDAFVITERARVYLGDGDKGNKGRLLSAGFHSMTGYFRDDQPLYELILDDAGRAELDGLWREFAMVSNLPARQYSSYLWFERAETNFVRGEEFDFVRAEDKDAGSDASIAKFREVYLAKAHRINAGEAAIQAVTDQFEIIRQALRQVDSDRAAAAPKHLVALQDFAARAFRRPLTDAEREGIARFYRTLRDQEGLSHEDAVRDTLVGILMSPRFLYRVDLPSGGAGIQALSDIDLASRLSYFLWASLPDAELLERAGAGDLHRPEVLTAQVQRMLRDPRARGLATEFAANWLDIRRFEEHNAVDRERFPIFDNALRSAMFEEPLRFFLDLVQRNGSIDEFLTANHTFVNPVLAKFYGMPTPEGDSDAWVRVDDATQYGRGGLLPMAVFLTRNSPGLRTSPVKRGYWVVKRLLGEAIPPPPADVPELPADEAKLGELTLRETLARHRADQACAGCHERFDGIGLAFEGYGPIGESRTVDLGGRPIDAKATFPRGGEGEGLAGLRSYLETHRRPEFAENLCRKLLAYALGRSLRPSDDETIEAMQARLARDGGRFGGLVEVIVTSPQFLNKRVEAETTE